MSTAKGSSKKKRASEATEPSKAKSLKQRVLVDDDDDVFGPEFSSVSLDIKAKIDELKSKIEKERQSFGKALSKSSKECENLLKSEAAKFQALCDNFNKEKAAHVQALQDTFSKFEDEKEKLFIRYEQQRKKEKGLISEQEKACANRIAELEESLKKKKQDDKTFSILRKTLGSFLEPESDDDFPADD
uniref:DNA ligase 1 n=1 Tax=Daucus carota subsp. sativus TaxID=79200 RepID=A0A175YM20_DAUCS